MEAVTISRKYQVVIPTSARKQLRLVPGQKIQVIAHGDRIEFILLKSARELRGMLRGLDTTFERDREDRVRMSSSSPARSHLTRPGCRLSLGLRWRTRSSLPLHGHTMPCCGRKMPTSTAWTASSSGPGGREGLTGASR